MNNEIHNNIKESEKILQNIELTLGLESANICDVLEINIRSN